MSESSELFAAIRHELKIAKKASAALGRLCVATASGYQRRLVEQIRNDIELPAHVHSQLGDPLKMQCVKCLGMADVRTVAQVGDFADRHAHLRGLAWTCSRCAALEYHFKSRCRFCNMPREGAAVSPSKMVVHHQFRLYPIRLRNDPVGSVMVQSLLRARRAARAMYPKEKGLIVRLPGIGEWDA